MESIKEFNTDIFKLFDDHWALVTAGTPEDYNTMTISWGSLGTIWAPRGNGRQIATIYIKPSRYTFNYLEKSDYYTISFFPEEKRKDLAYLGSHSGRDEDKLAATSLTPVEKSHGTMGFAEAELTLVCHDGLCRSGADAGLSQALQRWLQERKHPGRNRRRLLRW